MGSTYVDHEAYEWDGSYAYSSSMSGRVLTSISRHSFLPTLEELV